MTEHKIKVYSVEDDGLPDMDNLTGRVAFIFDGAIFSGSPLPEEDGGILWQNDEGPISQFYGIKHYVVFEKSLWEFE